MQIYGSHDMILETISKLYRTLVAKEYEQHFAKHYTKDHTLHLTNESSGLYYWNLNPHVTDLQVVVVIILFGLNDPFKLQEQRWKVGD